MALLTPYGRREWILATALVAVGIAASIYFAPYRGWYWSLIVIVPAGAVWLWVLWFFRDPTRTPPGDGRLLVSPADGKVTDITPIGADSPLGESGIKVGIFMSVFSVHVNRSPLDAVVEHVVHTPGVFLDARNPLASERNESATIFLSCPPRAVGGRAYPVVIRQVAGLVARRIVTDLQVGQRLTARGQRIGMIKFGSRMEVFVPEALSPQVLVKLGDKVRAGESLIVECRLMDDANK